MHSYRYLVVGVERLDIARDIAAVLVEGSDEAGEDVVQRNVVIARNNDLWLR